MNARLYRGRPFNILQSKAASLLREPSTKLPLKLRPETGVTLGPRTPSEQRQSIGLLFLFPRETDADGLDIPPDNRRLSGRPVA